MQTIEKLEKIIGYEFRNKKLLKKALTHPSYSSENSYERLEFLGDLILDTIVGIYLFNKYKKERESFLTNLKSGYVNSKFLHNIGEEINLKEFIYYKTPEVPKLDTFVEGIIGAIYLDSGWESAKKFVKKFILSKKIAPLIDYKNLLNDIARKKFSSSVKYKLIKEVGPPHKKIFETEVEILGEKIVGKGKGFSKKESEILAAKDLLEKYKLI